jgi:hypothetical protein
MLHPLKWITNANGILAEPCVHDAHLIEVSYRKSTLKIGIEGERDVVFTLHGVEETNLCIWQGSIISDIIIWRLVDLLSASKEMSGSMWGALFEGRLFSHDMEREGQRIIERNPNAFIFVVECSYGGPLACIADSIAVSAA